jgi:transcription-repair coupling factor (superfamily II helicase)
LLPLGLIARPVRARRKDGASLLEHLPPRAAVVLVGADAVRTAFARGLELFADSPDVLPEADLDHLLASSRRPLLLLGSSGADDPLGDGAPRLELPFQPAELHVSTAHGHDMASIGNELARLVSRGGLVTLACTGPAEVERLGEMFRQGGLTVEVGQGLRLPPAAPGVTLVPWSPSGGFHDPLSGTWLLAAHRLFARHRRRETLVGRRRIPGAHTAIDSFADLEEGSPVVHVSHGVALFQGVVRRERDGKPRDFLQLEFDGGTLYIPTERIGLIRRYVGPTLRAPRLSKLGGTGWQKKAKKAQEAVRDLAAQLLEVQAERQLRAGQAFPPDDRWQALFEESFPYTDTEDQARVTVEVKQDMELPRAMDRVVCGDVGYGKTEIAVRAAFKAVSAGYQVAVLCPTTVLAHQHRHTFSERMAAYPIRVEALSRFLSPAQQKVVVKGVAQGDVDVVLGTHRLLSRDVSFKKLGLVVVDEEQRFGVQHKERVKELRRTVDVLTLTATPIPRTLHMALSGARDISVLQSPPPGRSAVETKVVRFEKAHWKRVIERELARDGQLFVVHDRVKSIERVAGLIRELVPTARVLVVHGQMPEHDIEDRMLAFVEHKADVLVATTLIENGLDIRRANTLIVDRADRYGLAELHQLRGRVGRSDVRAYAYMVLPEGRELSSIAWRRLRAIEEFSDLGAGFQIAMRDLEIRGAGNVLGAAQSGHIANVGYDLYCRLLKRAVAEMRGELREAAGEKKSLDLERDLDLDAGEIEVVLDVPAYVPDAYVDDVGLKIECYRKLAQATQEDDLQALEAELRDRYGPLPEVLLSLFKMRRLRVRAAGLGVLKITRQDRVLQLRCRSRERLEAGIRAHHERLRPIDTHMLYAVMPDHEGGDEVQLDFLLELLVPQGEGPQPELAALDPRVVRRERKRRMRARAERGKRRVRGGPRKG